MILVTVGTERFDALVCEVDRLAARGLIHDRVYAQIGMSRPAPTHLDYVRYDRALLDKAAGADLIITHAGVGSVCEMIALGRPFIAVVDPNAPGDHQRQLVEQLTSLYDFCWAASPDALAAELPNARPASRLAASGVDALAIDITTALRSLCNMGSVS